jgi:hypothetical protein
MNAPPSGSALGGGAGDGDDGPAVAPEDVTRAVPDSSEEVTRNLRKPGRATPDGSADRTRSLRKPGRAVPDGSAERTRDLRRNVLRRSGPPGGHNRLGRRPGDPPSAPRRRDPEPAVERDEFGLPRARFTPPGPLPPPLTPSRPSTALIAVGVVVGVLFLGVAGLGLWAILGAGSGGTDAAELAVGDCILVEEMGAAGGPTVATAACGGPEANFRVVGTGSTTATCPGDVDNAFTQVADGAEPVAVCLDVDWERGDCFELSGTPVRVDCSDPPGAQTVRAAETLTGTRDAQSCSTRAGLLYDVRNFIVCLEQR